MFFLEIWDQKHTSFLHLTNKNIDQPCLEILQFCWAVKHLLSFFMLIHQHQTFSKTYGFNSNLFCSKWWPTTHTNSITSTTCYGMDCQCWHALELSISTLTTTQMTPKQSSFIKKRPRTTDEEDYYHILQDEFSILCLLFGWKLPSSASCHYRNCILSILQV